MEDLYDSGTATPATTVSSDEPTCTATDGRKRVVIVGLGMVAISFIEKLLKADPDHTCFSITVIGEEAHVAYNRVGLTSFFEHRKIEELYLNPKEWYDSQPALNHHLSTRVTEILPETREVKTSAGTTVLYDVLILATGSDAVVPADTPGHDATGVFVYRNIADLERMISYSASVTGSTGLVVGGGLLGLEAAKAMMDLNQFGAVKLVDKNPWVLSRQLDRDAGGLVIEKVEELGLEVLKCHKIEEIKTDQTNQVVGVRFIDGKEIECSSICFAIGIRPRDELAASVGIKTARRGGFIIDKNCETNVPGIYAVGECASWDNQTFGLIAPGVEMADVLAFNLCQSTLFGGDQPPRAFRRPDLSTKLKLLGVNVASFGDYFADRDGPQEATESPGIKALSYKDPFESVYKKYLFTADGKYLIGGMIIGDTKDYIKLVGMVKSKKPLEVPPSRFILGAKQDGEEDNPDDLPDDTQVCSCHNVSKGDISKVVKDGTCTSVGEVKSCTKAGAGCGGCMPLVQQIFNAEMKAMGAEVKNYLCPHFEYSRADLFNIISVKKYTTLEEVMKAVGKYPDSLGCEACKPTLGNIFASLFNRHVMDKPMHGLQDTNDKFLANIQRNGTFSVVPRVAGGEITPDKLIVIGTVAKKYGLYCKITGGQRIDMFGAKKQDLVEIWSELVDAGMESGHAYAKSLRTIKSCVGSTWCRFGIGDSVGMAIRLEERYKSIRGPHKIKSGVSGCVRECAEAQNKDFGLVATENGYNIYVGGNGGSKPRHSEILIKDCPLERVIPVLDRYLMFYIRTADKLQRTARWMENLPGGIKYLREVILDDRLGICDELERQMQELIGTYFCEWTEVVKNPERRAQFQQFANTGETLDGVEIITERDQTRPTYWPKEGAAKEDFRGTKWTSLAWQPMVKASYFGDGDTGPSGKSAAVKRGDTQLAIFKVKGKYYATQQMCPHKRAFILSDGLVGDDDKGNMWVSCPYHKRNFELKGENPGTCRNDEDLNIATFEIEERADGWVYLKLPPVEELDARLGTQKWMVKKGETEDPFKGVDGILKGRKSKKTAPLGNLPVEKPAFQTPVAAGGGAGLDW
ncbi:nitrite reductase [Tricharina praecox]|uniref:nitrite reductase n=1 Tax=Tricharina praecox TaxID=43433 RepID=UPI00221FD5BD|nr:nitrite reductase [Tricharina praecox]KAI5857959.1 nitrite reductase [Tricharina praecox]